MEKYIEENPNNPDREDDIRLTKNDTNKKKKNFKGFSTMEQIPDTNVREPFGEEIYEDLEEEKTEEEASTEFREENEYKKKTDRMKIEQLTTDIKMHESSGLTSVGPDVEGKIISGEAEEEFNHIEVDPASVNPGLETMNPYKNAPSASYVRKFEKNDKKIAKGKDNLKTIPKNKKERSLRGIIRNILGLQVQDASKKQKRENAFLEPYNKDEEAA